MTYGVRQFQLTLMHRMRDLNSDRVQQALTDLRASRAEEGAAHSQWTRRTYYAKGLSPYRSALGEPSYRGEHSLGAVTCDVVRWALPYWPGLEFEVMVGPDRRVWNQWFVRPAGDKKVSMAGLRPWTCVIGDVCASFPGARQGEGAAPQQWTVDFAHDGRPYQARFVYGLLQAVVG
ncbi:MAG: hypothetical protein HOV86_18885 [Thermoactinospora sp.]|nr:hypothetical protein [Thermoactinospora sp.]